MSDEQVDEQTSYILVSVLTDCSTSVTTGLLLLSISALPGEWFTSLLAALGVSVMVLLGLYVPHIYPGQDQLPAYPNPMRVFVAAFPACVMVLLGLGFLNILWHSGLKKKKGGLEISL